MIGIRGLWGFCMALADSVPGVSGGTVAFLLGFYDQFIIAIDELIRGKREERIHAVKFLIPLGIGWAVGMVLAVIALTKIFETHIYPISSFFLGLIVFAVPLIIHEERDTLRRQWRWCGLTILGIAFVALVSSVGIGGGSYDGGFMLIYIFAGGIIAVSAMVLPGISGSTLLLIMGLYLPVITSVRKLIGFEWSALPVVVSFGCGVLAGAVLVIRFLRFLLRRFRPQMIFLIAGLMLGSLYSVVLGPATLDEPKEMMTITTFQPLFFLLGGALLLGLQWGRMHIRRMTPPAADSVTDGEEDTAQEDGHMEHEE